MGELVVTSRVLKKVAEKKEDSVLSVLCVCGVKRGAYTIALCKKNEFESNKDIQNKIEDLKNNILKDGRVVIRPSGTEPLIRVMIEGKDIKLITKYANELAKYIEEKFG